MNKSTEGNPRILAVCLGSDVGTYYVHRSDGSTALVTGWTDEMTRWHRSFYGI